MGRLPSEYIELEYIQSSCTETGADKGPFINTGIASNSIGGLEVSFTRTGDLSYERVFGTDTNSGTFELRVNNTNYTTYSLVIEGSATNYSGFNSTTENIFKLYNNKVFLNSVEIASYTTPLSSIVNSLYISAGYNRCGNFRYKYFKVWNLSNELVRNFVPAKQVSDNAVGMYDTISRTFFANYGTGSFTAGPEAPEYRDIQYIQSSGTQYIDTGLSYGTYKTEIKMFTAAPADSEFTPSNSYITSKGATSYSATSPLGIAYLGGFDSGTIKAVNANVEEKTIVSNNVNLYGNAIHTLTVTATNNQTFNVSSVKYDINSTESLVNASTSTENICLLWTDGVDTSFRLYSQKFWELTTTSEGITVETLVRDFIPVVKVLGSEYTFGLYDNVNDVFYSNAGTGEFIGGEYSTVTISRSPDISLAGELEYTEIYSPTSEGESELVSYVFNAFRNRMLFDHWEFTVTLSTGSRTFTSTDTTYIYDIEDQFEKIVAVGYFRRPTITITKNKQSEECIVTKYPDSVLLGDTINFHAEVVTDSSGEYNYGFLNWEDSGVVVSSEPDMSVTVLGDMSLTGVFEDYWKKVYISEEPLEGGSVDVTGGIAPGSEGEYYLIKKTPSGAGESEYGTILLKAVPASSRGYLLAGWVVNGEIVKQEVISDELTLKANEFTTDNINVTAFFSKDVWYVEVLAKPESGGVVTGTGIYVKDTTCVLTALPYDGFELVKWTKDGFELETKEYIIYEPVTNNATYVAYFNVAEKPQNKDVILTDEYGEVYPLAHSDSNGEIIVDTYQRKEVNDFVLNTASSESGEITSGRWTRVNSSYYVYRIGEDIYPEIASVKETDTPIWDIIVDPEVFEPSFTDQIKYRAWCTTLITYNGYMDLYSINHPSHQITLSVSGLNLGEI